MFKLDDISNTNSLFLFEKGPMAGGGRRFFKMFA
jgi:hypothetical protein